MKNETVVVDRSVRGVAARVGISVPTVWRQIAAGKLKAKKIGRRTIVTEADERAWLDGLPELEPSQAAA